MAMEYHPDQQKSTIKSCLQEKTFNPAQKRSRQVIQLLSTPAAPIFI
jgi:hypothetical protein